MAGYCLVTGATGAIGPAVVRRLLESGYRIRTLSRTAPPAGLLPVEVEAQIGDITDHHSLRSALAGVSGVVHLAALLHVVAPPPNLRAEYERVNVGGTEQLVHASVEQGIERVVLFSSIAVYGRSDGEPLTEGSAPRPDSYYGETKLAAERIVLAARRRDGQALGTVLRLAAVYGPRVKGNYQRLVRALASGRFVPVGNGSNRRTLVYEEDVAEAARLALVHWAAAGQIYNVSDGEVHSVDAIVRAICEALERRTPRVHLPLTPVRLVAGLADTFGQMVGRRAFQLRSALDKYLEDIAVDGGRIQRDLGFGPRYDLRSGWRQTIDLMREHGLLRPA